VCLRLAQQLPAPETAHCLSPAAPRSPESCARSTYFCHRTFQRFVSNLKAQARLPACQQAQLAGGSNAHCILRQTKLRSTQEFGLPRQLLKHQPRNRLPAPYWKPAHALSPVKPAPAALPGTATCAPTYTAAHEGCLQPGQEENILGRKEKATEEGPLPKHSTTKRAERLNRSSGSGSESLPKSWHYRHKLPSR